MWETTIEIPIGPHKDVTIALRHNAVCFSGINQSGHRELWMSQGTNETTSNIHIPSFSGVTSHDPYNITAFRNKLYFTANDTGTGARGLFVYDPVANKTTEIINSSVADLNPPGDWQAGWGDKNQYTLTVFNNQLYFCATSGSGQESLNLWRTDGTTNSSGQATPHLVYPSLSNSSFDNIGQAGLQPFSLTTADL